jgi:hypothetical protein
MVRSQEITCQNPMEIFIRKIIKNDVITIRYKISISLGKIVQIPFTSGDNYIGILF